MILPTQRYVPNLLLIVSAYSCSLFLPAFNTHAAINPPKEDIHYMAEHLAEAAQEARFFALPWPDGDYSNPDWQSLVSFAGARASQGFANANGQLLTLGLSKNWRQNWNTELLVFYDRFHLSGDRTLNALPGYALNGIPLDLPSHAIFSHPDGEFIDKGIAILVSHEWNSSSHWSWDILGGISSQHFIMNSYTFNYELTDGINTGATGILDHSSNNYLRYYLIGIQARKIFTEHYTIIPRVIYGRPVQAGNFNTHITGPGFNLNNSASGTPPGQIGDQITYLGMTIRDISSQLEMDLGAIAGYAAFEHAAHSGIKSAIVISLTWRI